MSGPASTPVIFCIIEGLGHFSTPTGGAGPRTPVLDRLRAEGPRVRLASSPTPKPPGPGDVFEMLGTGRSPRGCRGVIDAAIRGGALAANETLQLLVRTASYHDVSWHVFTGLAEGHTAFDHLGALLDLAEVNRIRVVAHAVAGMEPGPRAAQARLEILDRLLAGRGVLGTLSGADYACDAEGNWDRTYRAFHAVVRDQVLGPAAPAAASWFDALRAAYGEGLQDRQIQPVRIGEYAGVRGDFVCDFAAASPAWEWQGEEIGLDAGHREGGFDQLLAMLSLRGVPEAVVSGLLTDRGKRVRAFADSRLFTLAGSGLPGMPAAFPHAPAAGALVETAARAGLAVFRCGEVSREAWLTRRLDGNVDQVWAGEERLFPSPVRDPASGRRNPDMCAYQIADRAAAAATGGRFDVVIAGIPELACTDAPAGSREWAWAMEAVDQALGDLLRAAETSGGVLVLAAPPLENGGTGWGLIRRPGEPGLRVSESGAWIDVAPTLLALLGLEPPPEMDGRSLLG